MKPKDLDSRIAEITSGRDYMLNHALDSGLKGADNYHPNTPKLKEAYEVGLQRWLNQIGINGIDSSLLSNPSTFRGFKWGLHEEGKLIHTGINTPVEEQRKRYKAFISQKLKKYDKFKKLCPEFEKEKEDFEKGLKLSMLVSNRKTPDELYDIFFQPGERAEYLFGIKNVSTLSDSRKRKLFDIYLDMLVRKSFEDVDDDKYPASQDRSLYWTKKSELQQQLESRDYSGALHTLDYMGMLLYFIEKVSNSTPIGIENVDGKEVVIEKEDTFEQALRNKQFFEQFDAQTKIGEVRRKKKEVREMWENPESYALQQRMNDFVAAEKYEEAAKIRDELKKLRGME
jgi:hypothetical protein